MFGVPARRKNAADDAKIGDGCRVDVEDRDSFGLPERNKIQTVEAADNANHVYVLTPLRRHIFIVSLNERKLTERSVLRAVVRSVEDVLRMVVIHLTIECSGCFCSHVRSSFL